METKQKFEKRGLDYPPYSKDGIKMSLVMTTDERREWFSDEEIEKWKKENPNRKFTGSML